MNKVEEAITKLVGPLVQEAGCTLWDVEYVKEAGQWFLRVYIDRADGVGIADCERVSRAVDPVLDEADVIPDSYIFEVSSAGAERQLKKEQDFLQFIGHLAEVKLYRAIDGRKEHVGTLAAYEDGNVTIEMAGTARRFEKNDIAMVRLRIAD
ncbi:MAG: ribosome maturation factor RimP [Oscillospiraceae bacterium]|nr:ribosome maturation factor RimP [Oscillospiraceae bacterium]